MNHNVRDTLHPYVIVVVLNYNNFNDTEECISSLLKIKYSNFSIIIVDNASPDGSGERLQKRFASIECILSETNGGYAAGNNIGIRKAIARGADYILILNNDTVVEPMFLNEMIEVLEKQTDAGISTCKILYERTKDIYVSAGRLSKVLCAIVPLTKRGTERVCEVSYIAGCAMLIKKEVFNDVGFLDESFFMYYEDVEFSIRAGKKFKLVYTPHSVIYHKSGGGDRWQNYSPFYFYYSSRNRILVFGGSNLMTRMYAFIANLVNVAMKVAYLVFYRSRHREQSIKTKVIALLAGMLDGLKNQRGKIQADWFHV